MKQLGWKPSLAVALAIVVVAAVFLVANCGHFTYCGGGF